MKTTGLALLAAWFLIAPVGVLADGCFIPPTAFAKVEIPDQRALIHYANGTETLVIDTSFKGEGTNFAWIVPLPSQPKVEVATTGLFPTLQSIFQPQIIHNVGHDYWFTIIIGVIVSSFIFNKRGGGSFVGMVVLWFFLLFVVAITLPAFVTAGGEPSPAGPVEVLDRKIVGIYDTATLASRDGGALLDWLNKNGFATPTNFIPAIRAYAAEGWGFVASKIHLDSPLSAAAKAHPLSFTFKTDRPVYPLRLTAIGNKICRIELYVFADTQAGAPNFKMERCSEPTYPPPKEDWHNAYTALRVRHPQLQTLVKGSAVATKLTAELTTEQMQQDAYIIWRPFEEERVKVYSAHGAAIFTTNIAVPLLIAGLLVWYWTSALNGKWARRSLKISRFASLAALVAWFPIYWSLPKIPVHLARRPAPYMHRLGADEIPAALEYSAEEMGKQTNAQFKPDLTWVRQQLQGDSKVRKELIREQTNLFTGLPWHEEDSPGNYTLRQTQGGIEYRWYDIDDGEHLVPLFRRR